MEDEGDGTMRYLAPSVGIVALTAFCAAFLLLHAEVSVAEPPPGSTPLRIITISPKDPPKAPEPPPAAAGAEQQPQEAPTVVVSADQAQALQNAGRWEEAAAAWGQIVKSDAENAAAWFNLGYCLHLGGHLEEAIAVHRKAADFEQYHGIALYNLGCAFALTGRTDEAFDTLAKAQAAGFGLRGQAEGDSDLDSLRNDPRYRQLIGNERVGFWGRVTRGVSMIAGQIQRQAPQIQREVIHLANQADRELRNVAGHVLRAAGSNRFTAPIARKMQQMVGGSSNSRENAAASAPSTRAASAANMADKARQLQNEQQWIEAVKAYQMALQSDAENPMLWFNMGYCLHAAGMYDQAIPVHQKAATYNDVKGIALYNLGCAYSLTGKLDEAVKALHASREAGFNIENYVADDSDLDNLRDDPRFVELLADLGVGY